MKNILSNIRNHKCKIFYSLFGVYLFSLLTTFIVSQGIQFNFSETELNNFDNKFNIGFQLTDLIELSDSEEKTENKVQFSCGFIKDSFKLNFSEISSEISLISNAVNCNFNHSKCPKYLLIHQLIVYS